MTEETPFFPVTLYQFKGTHRELGRQQGEQLSDLIRDARDFLLESYEFNALRPGFLPKKIFLFLAQAGMWLKYTAHIKQFYPKQFERMMGIARGAGVSPEFLMLLQSFEVEMNKTDYRLCGCSAVGMRGARAENREPLIIKNFDYPNNFRELYITRLDQPLGRNRVLSVTAAPLPGNHDGINEHGLCIAYNYGYGQDVPVANTPITLLVQEALETCATTREAVDLITRGKRCGGAILMICDSQGDLRTLELSNTRTSQRMPQHSVLINTNHYLTDDMLDIDIPANAVYSDKSVPALRGMRCRDSSEARYARAIELLAQHEVLNDKILMEIFSDHGADNTPSDNTICRHSDYFRTTCSIIFHPVRRTLKVFYGNPCVADFKEFSVNNMAS